MNHWQDIQHAIRNDDSRFSGDRAVLVAMRAEVLLIESGHESNVPDIPMIIETTREIAGVLERLDDRSRQIRLLLRLARWLERMSRWDDAMEVYSEAEAAGRGARFTVLYIQSMEERGEILRRRGCFDAARSIQSGALDQARSADLKPLAAHALNNIGVIDVDQGKLTEALTHFNEALDMIRGNLEPILEGHLYNNLGVVECIMGHPDTAYPDLKRAESIRRTLHDMKGFAETSHNLGMALMDTGRIGDAESALDEALNAAESIRDAHLRANILLSRAELMIRLNRREIAQRCVLEAQTTYSLVSDQLGSADAGRILADMLLTDGKIADARAIATRSIEVFRSLQHVLGVAQTAELLARIARASGEPDVLRASAVESMEAYRCLGNDQGIERIRTLMTENDGCSINPGDVP